MEPQATASTTYAQNVSKMTHELSYSPPVEIGAWLACLFFVLAMINQGQKFFFNVRGKPTPSEQAGATASLSEKIAKIGAVQHEHERRLDAFEKRLVEEVNGIYKRVNTTAEGVSRIEGKIDALLMQKGGCK